MLMIKFFRKTVARKVALIVGLSGLLVTALGLIGMLVLFQSDVRVYARNSLSLLCDSLAVGLTSFDAQIGQHPMVELIAELERQDVFDRVQVFNRNGRVVWSQNETEVGDRVSADLLKQLKRGRRSFLGSEDEEGLGILRQIRAGQSCLKCHAAMDGIARGDLLGGIFMQTRGDTLSARMSSYAHLQVTTALLLVVFLTVLTALTLRMFVGAPLRRLNRAISAAEDGNFLHRVEVKTPDEVGRLADSFNRLLTRLTEVQASKIDSEMELDQAQRALSYKSELEKKNRIIEETNIKLTKRLNELGLLFDITRALTSTLELERVLEVINELIGVTLKFQKFSILLLDDRRERLKVRFVYGQQGEEAKVGTEVDPNQGLFAQAFRTGRQVLVDDLSLHSERIGPVEKSLPQTGSFLCIPMVHKNSLLGMLTFTREKPAAFPKAEIRFLTLVARQASMALLNAQLYQEKLELSVTDDLTKLANRRQMQTRLEMEWNRARRFKTTMSVLMIDIDLFKRYNDINGHLLGDEVLSRFARVLEGNTRKVDTVARFGGEEFVVILPGQDKKTAASVGEKLRRAVAETEFSSTSSQPKGHLTITVGVATFPEDSQDPTELIDRADLALYVAKRAGRDQVSSYEEGMLTAAEEHRKAKAKKRNRKRGRRRKSPDGSRNQPRVRNRGRPTDPNS